MLIPFIFVMCYSFFIKGFINNVIYLSILLSVILFEAPFLNEIQSNSKIDKGIISGFLVSSVMSFSWLCSYNSTKTSIAFSSTMIVVGILIRVLSKYSLSNNFSHSLRIKDEQKLVDKGLYSLVRHPSYTGTFIIIIGATNLSHLNLRILLLLLSFIYMEYRVSKEEVLLTEHFGSQYKMYISRTKKFIPYLY